MRVQVMEHHAGAGTTLGEVLPVPGGQLGRQELYRLQRVQPDLQVVLATALGTNPDVHQGPVDDHEADA